MNYNNVNKSFTKHVKLLKKSINRNVITEAAKKPQKVVNTIISIIPHSKTKPEHFQMYTDSLEESLAQYVRGNIKMHMLRGPNNQIVITHSVEGSTAKDVKKDLTDIRDYSEEWARKNGLGLNISWYVDVK